MMIFLGILVVGFVYEWRKVFRLGVSEMSAVIENDLANKIFKGMGLLLRIWNKFLTGPARGLSGQ